MKTIKNIPVVTKSLTLLSIIFYLLNCYDGNINIDFGMYQISDKNFSLYQILTFSFCHNVNPFHLLNNIAFFILVSSLLEKVLGHKMIGLVLLTILINVIGINLIDIKNNVLGLSSILFSTIALFILSKNNLESTLSFGLKFVLLIYVVDVFLILTFGVMDSKYTPDFYSAYLHLLGIISGTLFFLFYKIKKLILG
jgi:membrane associated rhomboid family serine protease